MQPITEENEIKLTQGLQKVYAYIVQKTKTEKDNEIAAKIKNAFETADLETPVTDDDLGDATFDVAEVITSLTDTKVDDAVVSTGRGVYNATQGRGGVAFFEAIKGLIATAKEKRLEKKAAKEEAQGEGN